MKSVKLLLPLLLLSLVHPRPAVAQTDATTKETTKAVHEPPEKLVIEIEVPAPVDDVWQAFTTSAGLSTWLTPDATVDLRAGGEWTARFPGGSTGGGTIVSFVPEKELVIAAQAPEKFPHVRADRTRATFQFEPRGNSTIVRLTQTGWKSGDEWTRAYEYLAAGNAQLMATLHHRFVDGPIDWEKVFGNSKPKAN